MSAMPLFVMMNLACIKPYNISAACSIKSFWFGFSSISSSAQETKKQFDYKHNSEIKLSFISSSAQGIKKQVVRYM